MDLKSAQSSVEEKFSDVMSRIIEDGSKDYPIVWSGGVTDWDSISPALFSSEERAITAWLNAVNSVLPKNKKSIEWLIEPELTQYQITIADRKQRHRIVSDRFTVKSQFLVNGLPTNV